MTVFLQIIDEKSGEAAIVDPVAPDNVMAAVKAAQVNLTAIITTHHHWWAQYHHCHHNTSLLVTLSHVCYYSNTIT